MFVQSKTDKRAILKLVVWATLMLAGSFPALADTQSEIQHLLTFVGQTECQYERNGERHSGQEAVAHIQKKYDYYQDEIKTAEDFIRYSATKSSMSGKVYLVHCEGQAPLKSDQWLLTELAHFRSKQH